MAPRRRRTRDTRAAVPARERAGAQPRLWWRGDL